MKVTNPIRTLEVLKHTKSLGYKVYDLPYQLNLIAYRSSKTKANRFDDTLHVIFKNDTEKWEHYTFNITTDPGTYWLENYEKLNVNGTALLKAGQYIGAYAIGLHRSKVWALRQVKDVSVLRQYDRDNRLDFYNGIEQTGMFYINIHPAAYTRGVVREEVGEWSAGCQVFQSYDEYIDVFKPLCEKHKELYGNSFTYTLIDYRARTRLLKKRIVFFATCISIAGLVWKKRNKKTKHTHSIA